MPRRAYDIVQPDVANSGGITEMRNVAMMANSLGIRVSLDVWGSPIMIAATLHLAATIAPCPPSRAPESFVQEPVMGFGRTRSGIRQGIVVEPFDRTDGFVAMPNGPGLGIEIDEQVVKRLAVTKTPTIARLL